MKINGVHALVSLLSQQMARRQPATDKADRIRALSLALQHTDDPEERLAILRDILAESNVRRTGIKWVDDQLAEKTRHEAEGWPVSMGAADKINQLARTLAGRQWESQTTGEGPKDTFHGLESNMMFSKSAVDDTGLDRFVPTSDDLEKAIVLVQRKLTATEDSSFRLGGSGDESDPAELKGRMILISVGLAILLGVVTSLF